MVKAAVNAKVNFSMPYLISEMIAGSHMKLYQVCLRISYQGTKFCFSLYFSFMLFAVHLVKSYVMPSQTKFFFPEEGKCAKSPWW